MKPFNEKEREKKVSGQYVISVSIPIEPTLPPHNIIMVIRASFNFSLPAGSVKSD